MTTLGEHAVQIAAVLLEGGPKLYSAEALGVSRQVLGRVDMKLLVEHLKSGGWRWPYPRRGYPARHLTCERGRACVKECGRFGPPQPTAWEGWEWHKPSGKDDFGRWPLICPDCKGEEA